ncbi:hypothetical protein ACFV4K_33725, partial [Nocardia sp. NPDC059764]|uniref:hypothetical protein n=1 Tax=Nocardia sp. NPDC059764 TaxID=3346939 RepID=UPI0036644799
MTVVIVPSVPRPIALLPCRRITLSFQAEQTRLRDTASRLALLCHRRWLGRSDFDMFPPLHRWGAVPTLPLPQGLPTPHSLISAAAQGARLAAATPVEFLAAAIMLSTGCPAAATTDPLAPTPGPSLTAQPLSLSILAMDEDDASLAVDLAATAIAVSGGRISQRHEDWIPLDEELPQHTGTHGSVAGPA